MLDHLVEEVARGETLALESALHVRHREEDSVYISGFDLRAQGVQVEAARRLSGVHLFSSSLASGELGFGLLQRLELLLRRLGDEVVTAVECEVGDHDRIDDRSEEHTSELQSRQYLVCR